MIIFIIILTLIICSELGCVVAYGWLIPKTRQYVYTDLKTEYLELNPLSNNIISLPTGIGRGNFISTVPLSFLAKYYINGVGMVPRRSQLHKEIKEHFRILNAEKLVKIATKNSKFYK